MNHMPRWEVFSSSVSNTRLKTAVVLGDSGGLVHYVLTLWYKKANRCHKNKNVSDGTQIDLLMLVLIFYFPACLSGLLTALGYSLNF